MFRMFKGDKSFITKNIDVSQFMIVSWKMYIACAMEFYRDERNEIEHIATIGTSRRGDEKK